MIVGSYYTGAPETEVFTIRILAFPSVFSDPRLSESPEPEPGAPDHPTLSPKP